VPTKDAKLQEILDNIKRQEMKKHPALQAVREDKYTITPFGKVWSKLLTINNKNKLRKGEILAQWIRDKQTGKKEKFLWMGIVEKCEYNCISLCYRIYYRPFVDQVELENKRFDQLYTKQMY
jgi:hypothetical protein